MGLLFVNVWRGMCLLLAVFSGNVAVAQEITLRVIEPDPASQPVPCPNQTLVYECTVDGYIGLVWTFETSGMTDELVLNQGNVVGDTSNSSNGQFSATLINSERITGSNPAVNLMTSTLVISPPLNEFNGLPLTCIGNGAGTDMDEMEMTIVTLSGIPDPPQQLEHNVSANTESSAVIQWQSPNNTGGNNISIINYIMVTDNGQTASVSGDVFTYTITGLDFNTDHIVEVTAVNSCGLKSEPAIVTVNIEARVAPVPALLPTELHCDVPLEDGRPVVINWMYGNETQDEGVVYPGEVKVRVDLDPEAMGCSDVTADDTSCTATITSDEMYSVSLNVSNNLDSTMTMRDFDLSLFLVESEDLSPETGLSVTVTVNPLCPDAVYPVLASFGTQMADGNDNCSVQQNDTDSATLGNSVTLTADPNSIPLGTGQEYCVVISTNGEIVANITDDGKDSQTVIVAAGVSAGVAFVAVIVITPGGVYIWYRKKKIRPDGKKTKNLSGHACLEAEDFPPAATTELGATYQDPTTITRTPHPTTGEVYTDVKLDKKKREKVEVGPMYQDPSAIEHQQAASGDTYALPQKGKKGKKGEKGEVGEGERELTEEEKAGLYSTPDRKGQKAKSDGLTYARLDMQPTSKKAPPPAGSMYVDLQHPN
jgi:hypothetical protein